MKTPLNFTNLSCEVGMPISKNFTFVSTESQTLRILYLFKYEKLDFLYVSHPSHEGESLSGRTT